MTLRGSPGRPREALGGRGGSRTSKGKKSPWKERAIPASERVSDATDPFAVQHLEVEGRCRTALLPPTGNGERGGRPPGGAPTARRDQAVVTRYGCGRGELFEGSRRREERGPSPPGARADHPGGSPQRPWERVSAKRGEPHDRLRDATSPRAFARRKPPRWCETTRAERGWTGGAVGPMVSRGNPGLREWTRAGFVGGGAERDEPQERKGLDHPVRTPVPTGPGREGPGPCADASKETGTVHGVPKTSGSPLGCDAPVTSSRAPDR